MTKNITDRQAFALAVLSAADDAKFTPVQIQKLFFLLDENAHGLMHGRKYSFEPYDYGPFDKSVYGDLEDLARAGLVLIEHESNVGGRRLYSATLTGQERGSIELSGYQESLANYIQTVSEWVRGLSFAELVGAIYRAYPKMKENSVFDG